MSIATDIPAPAVIPHLAKQGSKWIVSYPGRFGERSSRFKTKREAQAYLIEIERQADWETRLLAMDATGQYTFTPEQDAEIENLVTALRENRTRLTLTGPKTLRETSAKEHTEELKIIHQWDAFPGNPQGKLTCAEIRWRRAGRIEAFKRAKLDYLLPD